MQTKTFITLVGDRPARREPTRVSLFNMKTQGSDQVNATKINPESGLTKRELMAIEFTKALLGLRHYDNQPIYTLAKGVYNPDDEFCHWTSQEQADRVRLDEVNQLTEKALFVADSLIKALNEGGQNG